MTSGDEILRPNAAGDTTELSNTGGGENNWLAVSDVIADDLATYVYLTSDGSNEDLYNLPVHSGSGVINSVTVYVRCYANAASQNAKATLKTNGIIYRGDEELLSANWTTFSKQWTTNPNTLVTWTWDDIDALQIGVWLSGTGGLPKCTQVYVAVNYTSS